MSKWKEKFSNHWGKEKINKKVIEDASKFGAHLASEKNKLTTSQLRKFFGEIKRLQLREFDYSEFVLLKPKLAYAVGRAKKDNKIRDLYYVLADGIDKVSDKQDFKKFIKIFEAIVAYHKAAEENNLIISTN